MLNVMPHDAKKIVKVNGFHELKSHELKLLIGVKENAELTNFPPMSLERSLKQKGYRLFLLDDGIIYAFKKQFVSINDNKWFTWGEDHTKGEPVSLMVLYDTRYCWSEFCKPVEIDN